MSSSSLTYWGLLGQDSVGPRRRSRTLELGAVVRRFNKLAVPGMGNVWYCKQIYLAALGVAVAEKARNEGIKVKNIEMGNAIEALACLLSLDHTNWKNDPRLRGSNKLKDVIDISFKKVRKPGFYVTQPMRMGIVPVLPSLKLVYSDSIRYNSFKLTDLGCILLDRISNQHPRLYGSLAIIDFLLRWVFGTIEPEVLRRNVKLRLLLSPLTKLDADKRAFIKSLILKQGNAQDAVRRKSILDWVNEDYIVKRGHLDWAKKPTVISEEHWRDLQAGALFFKAQEKAIELLDSLEDNIGRKNINHISIPQATKELNRARVVLHEAALAFLRFKHNPIPQATEFCKEAIDPGNCIRRLIERDGIGLKLRGELIVPGPAFKGVRSVGDTITEDDDFESMNSTNFKFPEYISPRVRNMFYLNQDLNGMLHKWL